mmetsp:Transcript_36025/g.35005  ORF Transcript_36025/g.35005 Transcript_36025/m.35005 type:complete len:107 (+) Transcript_36025:301-621(+)
MNVCKKLGIEDDKGVSAEDLQKVMERILQGETRKIFTENVNWQDFYKRFFYQYMRKGGKGINLDKLCHVFGEHFSFEINIRQYLNLGLTFSIRHFEDLKLYYKKLF